MRIEQDYAELTQRQLLQFRHWKEPVSQNRFRVKSCTGDCFPSRFGLIVPPWLWKGNRGWESIKPTELPWCLLSTCDNTNKIDFSNICTIFAIHTCSGFMFLNNTIHTFVAKCHSRVHNRRYISKKIILWKKFFFVFILMIRAYSSWKTKIQYLKIEYLHLSFNKWPSLQYKFRVSLVPYLSVPPTYVVTT